MLGRNDDAVRGFAPDRQHDHLRAGQGHRGEAVVLHQFIVLQLFTGQAVSLQQLDRCGAVDRGQHRSEGCPHSAHSLVDRTLDHVAAHLTSSKVMTSPVTAFLPRRCFFLCGCAPTTQTPSSLSVSSVVVP